VLHKHYTGVGSRRTPKDIMLLMVRLSQALSNQGFNLRTGAAEGADQAFIMGSGGNNRVYYPSEATHRAKILAKRYHNAWYMLSEYAKKLHARNVFQVLGSDMQTPSKFLICWTPDGCKTHRQRRAMTGGTGTAISIASENQVPIYNLKRPKDLEQVKRAILKSCKK